MLERPSSRPKVVLITTSFPRWPYDPAGCFVASAAAALHAAGMDPRVVAPDHPAVRRDGPERPLGDSAPVWVRRAQYHPIRRRQRLAYGAGIPENTSADWSRWLQAPALCTALLWQSIQAARRADLVLGNWLLPGALVGVLAARRAGVPHVALLHSAGVSLAQALPGGRQLARTVLRGSVRVIAVSAQLAKRFEALVGQGHEQLLAERLVVQPMGVDRRALGEAQPRARERRALGVSGRFVVGFLGRVVPIKGLLPLVRSMAGLSQGLLLVAGEGPQLGEAGRLAERLGVELRSLGRIEGSERARFFSACDAFAIPSLILANGRTEGTPVSALEAMTMGVPVVASAVGGLPEVVSHGRSGYLFPPGDEGALAAHLKLLASRPGVRRRLGSTAREQGQRFSWSVVGPKLAGVCEEALRCAR